MKRSIMVWLAPVALFLAFASSAPSVVEASHPPYPQPLLYCSDVNGDGAVSVGDLTKVVGKFGTNDPAAAANATYHPLYDLTTPPGSGSSGAVAVNDIVVAVSDFGQMCPALDTQIARSTLAVLALDDAATTNCAANWNILVENVTCLRDLGYVRGSSDVPGQGVHYINFGLWDGVFNPLQPDGLVYQGGRLGAQLHYASGDNVGWDPTGQTSQPCPANYQWHAEMSHCMKADQVQTDPFCTSGCSWTGTADGWHWHKDLCTVGMDTASALAIPGDLLNIHSEQDCATWAQNNGFGTNYRWDEDSGWMGHLWNHRLNANVNSGDVLGNGRFADCFPDMPDHWTGFNCPQ